MIEFPDHPIIAAMERDGQLRRRGTLFSCRNCGCDICAGETYYFIDDKTYCIGCSDAALQDYTHTAEVPNG